MGGLKYTWRLNGCYIFNIYETKQALSLIKNNVKQILLVNVSSEMFDHYLQTVEVIDHSVTVKLFN